MYAISFPYGFETLPKPDEEKWKERISLDLLGIDGILQVQMQGTAFHTDLANATAIRIRKGNAVNIQ